jgi:hypothetical protein
MWIYASHRGRWLARDYDRMAVRHMTRGYLMGPVVYIAALVLAFFSVAASVGLCYALTLYFALPGNRDRKGATG